eukprot:TRINITY_DN23076_c0_g2_i2.p1 TRINITY_DN23076_c0_g2~~TRINITY_DN23076_c0_g2_i2.p1  ORF type:complete len:169 (-),score=11.16 TRINITY_DN23076_c0_g2_i2:33-539(-)
MFDVLLLLSVGKQMYFGPAKQAPYYFEQPGFPFPDKFNPADFFLDVVSADDRSKMAEFASKERIELLAESFRNHEEHYIASCYTEQIPEVSKKKPEFSSSDSSKDNNRVSNFKTNGFHQYGTLLKRAVMQVTRDKFIIGLTFVQNIFIAILLGLIYLDQDNDQKSIQK